MALFGRYDPDLRGEIDYMQFIAKAMFYSADGSDAAPMPKPKKVPFVVPGTPKESTRDEKNADLYRVADVDNKDVSFFCLFLLLVWVFHHKRVYVMSCLCLTLYPPPKHSHALRKTLHSLLLCKWRSSRESSTS
jgi:hypothetical protein